LRLKPAPSVDEAFHFLNVSASLAWGPSAAIEIQANLRSIAEAMSVVAALEIPGETEPLFGEDPEIAEGSAS